MSGATMKQIVAPPSARSARSRGAHRSSVRCSIDRHPAIGAGTPAPHGAGSGGFRGWRRRGSPPEPGAPSYVLGLGPLFVSAPFVPTAPVSRRGSLGGSIGGGRPRGSAAETPRRPGRGPRRRCATRCSGAAGSFGTRGRRRELPADLGHLVRTEDEQRTTRITRISAGPSEGIGILSAGLSRAQPTAASSETAQRAQRRGDDQSRRRASSGGAA
jgi:hypothetical protein